MSRLLIGCLSFLLTVYGYAQDKEYRGNSLDSLIQVFPTVGIREKQEIIFEKLYLELTVLDKEAAFKQALEIRTLAEKSKTPYAYFFASMNLAKLASKYQDQDNALLYILRGVSFTANRGDENNTAHVYFYSAEFFRILNMLPLALEYSLKAADLFSSNENYTYASRCHSLACLLYHSVRNYNQSIEEGLSALDDLKNVPNKELEYTDRFMLMSTHNTIGLSAYKTNNFELALDHYSETEKLAHDLKNEFWVALVNGNRASVYIALKQYEKALAGLQLDLKASKKYKEFYSAARASVLISSIYIELNDMKLANLYFDSATYLIDDPYSFRSPAYWMVQSRLRKAKGDLLGALNSQEMHLKMIDSINNQKEALNLESVKTSFELQKKQKEIETLAAKEQQQQDQIKTQRIIILSSVIISVLLLALIFIYIRSVNRLKSTNNIIKQQRDEIESKNEELELQSKNLKEINDLMLSLNSQLELKVSERTHELEKTMEELDTFLYRSSHDMRRPLSTLLGIENIAKIEVKEESSLKLFHMVAETALQMDRMLLKMQMAHELDQTVDKLESVVLSTILKDLVKRIQQLGTNTQVVYEGIENIEIVSNARLLYIIFYNLFENAINFRKTDGSVHSIINVQVKEKDDYIVIKIEDNGLGIEPEFVSKIFDQYFKGSQVSKGNGLGLYLVKKSVNKLKGKIKVKSTLGEGTTFTVSIVKKPLS